MRHLIAGAFLCLLFVLSLSPAYALQLPITVKRDQFTVTILSYRMIDEKHVIVDLTVRNDYNFTIRIQYGQGSAASSDGVELGIGSISPDVDLLPHTAIPMEAYLESRYSYEQLLEMRDSVRSVRVHAEVLYCIPVIVGWWEITCFQPPSFIQEDPMVYDHTFTVDELVAIGQDYGLV